MMKYWKIQRQSLHQLRLKATKADKITPLSLVGKCVRLPDDGNKEGRITSAKGGWFTVSLQQSNQVFPFPSLQAFIKTIKILIA